MNTSFFRICPTAAAMLLAALPLLATAQNTHQDSVLRGGDLVGGRPRPAGTRPATASRASVPNADPTLAKIMHESIDVNRLAADQMIDVYSRFLEATRDQRRQWGTKEWDDASAALTRLNTRYEAVRLELPLDDRLSVRSYQVEFRTLQGARRVNDRLDETKSKR